MDENTDFKNMINHRVSTGCNYRFEITVEGARGELDDVQTFSSVATSLALSITSMIKQEYSPHIRLVEPSLFPKCLLTIHDYLWRLAEGFLNTFQHNGPSRLMNFGCREYVCFLEMLKLTSLNGNMKRNLVGDAATNFGIVTNIRIWNWPFLSNDSFDQVNKAIVLM